LTYSLIIKNSSGLSKTVAIYQIFPNSGTNFSLVLFSKLIPENVQPVTFKWEMDWGLNWGTSSDPLATGVAFAPGGLLVPTQPNLAGGINTLEITYENKSFTSKNSWHDLSLTIGKLQVITDSTFTAIQAGKMSVALYLNGNASVAFSGQPNSKYPIDVSNPAYYLVVTDLLESEVISVNGLAPITRAVMSNSKELPPFTTANPSQTYTLNTTLHFEPGLQ
jgi:hypothetical protein